MFSLLTETSHTVTVSHVHKPRTVRIDAFHGWREEGRMRYGFSTVEDAAHFLTACGYASTGGSIVSRSDASFVGRPATATRIAYTWTDGSGLAELHELTVVPAEKEMEMIKIQVQFFNHPVCSYTVRKLNERTGERHKELDVYTGSLRCAIDQFIGKFYPRHKMVFVDKLNGDTFAIYFKKPAHFAA